MLGIQNRLTPVAFTFCVNVLLIRIVFHVNEYFSIILFQLTFIYFDLNILLFVMTLKLKIYNKLEIVFSFVGLAYSVRIVRFVVDFYRFEKIERFTGFGNALDEECIVF